MSTSDMSSSQNESCDNDSEKMPNFYFHPIINGLQKMALYKTRSFFYIIGSDITQTKFRVLKVDRTEPKELVLVEDKVEYTQREIKALIATINDGNRKPGRSTGGVSRSASAFGILGFIRFWEGYYIILITKRRKIAVIGYHSIYKIEDTSMLYVPHESVRKHHDDEHKYVRLFNNIDLTSNFYFSYSYDLTNSLQYNMAPFYNLNLEDDGRVFENFMNLSFDDEVQRFSETSGPPPNQPECEDYSCHVGYRNTQKKKYIWNWHLLKPMKDHVHPAWFIPVIHGFVAQSNICVYGRTLFLTLIARRSACYAGTRFLKRGANFEGDVANEVETEQMLHDSHISSLRHGRFSSFVQIRGSIPCHWSQDVSKMVPKPQINIDIADPYAVAAGKHFNQLLRRFGSPIIALNLVKRREKKRHESLLNEEYGRLIRQLNITLPPQFRILHIAVDMARINKDKEENVMSHLADIAYKAVKRTGIFFNKNPYFGHHLNVNSHYKQLEKASAHGNRDFGTRRYAETSSNGRLQTGVVRVNCVDCLDRTNTAQFALGKCALAFQLYVFGILEKPVIEFDSDCVRILEHLYEDHGDTLALQYGGSQLVHRIETYRKTAPWTSHTNDIMQSFSRYYSNKFSDQEKQNAINLFLGVFVPTESCYPIWDLTSDYLLHQSLARDLWPSHLPSTTQWWDADVMDCLPFPFDQMDKTPEIAAVVNPHESKIDIFNEYHRPFEMNVLTESFHFNMPHSVRDYRPGSFSDANPFYVPGKKQEESSLPKRRSSEEPTSESRRKNPSISGRPSTSSASSGTSSSGESELSEGDHLSLSISESEAYPERPVTKPYSSFFPPVEDFYGTVIKKISVRDFNRYKEFVRVERFLSDEEFEDALFVSSKKDYTPVQPLVTIKHPSPRCMAKYKAFVDIATNGPQLPDHESLLKYRNYASYY